MKYLLSLLVLVTLAASCGDELNDYPPHNDAGDAGDDGGDIIFPIFDVIPPPLDVRFPDVQPDVQDDIYEEPDVEDPDVGEPDTDPEPDVGEPDVGEPDAGDPDVGEPDTGDPDVGEPDAGDPDVGEPDTGEPDAGDPDTGGGFEYHPYEVEVLQLVNQYRSTPTDCGQYGTLPAAPALVLNEELTKAARVHSQDMADNSFMSHTGSDGSSFVDRVDRTDYTGFARGENIAYGYSSPASVMEGWIGSDGHCRNIMMGDATEIGVGYIAGGSNRHSWTQVFGRGGGGTDPTPEPDPDPEPDPEPEPEPEPDACLDSDPYPSDLINPSALVQRQGRLEFVARDGNVLNAYTHRSPKFDAATGQIVFIMHGTNRNADDYLDNWRSRIDQHNALAIAPEYPKSLYPGSEDYQLGVGTSGTPYTGTYRSYQWRDPADYTHSEIEHLFEAVRDELGNESCTYSIFGHSAGGQFVHRLITFRPDARIDTAVAANAGWYTLPTFGDGSFYFHMPYGLNGTPPDDDRQEQMFAKNLIVLLGEDDTERGQYLRTTSEADYQGRHRLERGQFYYATGQQEAQDLGVPFNWTLDTVPGVGHSNSGMVPAASAHIFGGQ